MRTGICTYVRVCVCLWVYVECRERVRAVQPLFLLSALISRAESAKGILVGKIGGDDDDGACAWRDACNEPVLWILAACRFASLM